ncbi:MAG: hypothetical protein JO335_01225 [Sphingomonas sp.]|nr:hypothetical protein [Sphingomonas sp.]
MATFCETLAETAVVAEACEAARMGISGAYAARRRLPAFAAAWDAALGIARERLADTLLARSMEGNVEQLYRDGELVGEKHVIDNRLGLAILRRLDRLADTGLSTSARGVRAPTAPSPVRQPIDWNFAIEALRTGDDEGVAKALALIEGHKVEEVEGPPNSLIQSEGGETLDLSDRCWWSEVDGCWLTDFPPPAGFTGYESRGYDEIDDEEPYVRACTEEEAAILAADAAADRAADRAEDELLRDEWFAFLRAELSSSNRHAELGSASIVERDGEASAMDPETSSG